MKGKKAAVARALELGGLAWLTRRVGGWQGLLVLNYHRLARSADEVLDRGVWSAEPDTFARQVAWLQRETELLSPEDLPAALEQRGRHTLLTFDDGYADNVALALPILAAAGAKAAFFPVTAWLDEPRVPGWDELAWMVRHRVSDLTALGVEGEDDEAVVLGLLRSWRRLSPEGAEAMLDRVAETTGAGRAPAELARSLFCTWDDVRRLSAAGMTIGGHTHRHVCMATLDAEAQRREIDLCSGRIEAELGQRPTWFSYPYGAADGFTDVTVALLRAQGYRIGCSQFGGWQARGQAEPFNLRRIAIDQPIAPPLWRAAVTWPSLFAR
ncbi:MAG: polysaccharide deacetylase family protein [Armatimonadetes bacterium]|nr:polysaccharide deacetylase family protein [Armatimonadota bacterium]